MKYPLTSSLALVLGLLAAAFSSNAFAMGKATPRATPAFGYGPRVVEISTDDFKIKNGDIKNIPLTQMLPLDRIFITADTWSGDATLEVIVNGDVKGMLNFSSSKSSQVVTVGERANFLQLRHVSGSNLKVRNIQGVTAGYGHGGNYPPIGGHPGYFGNVAGAAQSILFANDALKDFVTLEENMQILNPLRKASARMEAVASVRGDMSEATRNAVLETLPLLDAAVTRFEPRLESEALAPMIMDLMAAQDFLEALLQ